MGHLHFLLLCGYLATLALVPAVLLRGQRNPASTVAWLMSILFLPYLGAFLFAVFGVTRIARHTARRRRVLDRKPGSPRAAADRADSSDVDLSRCSRRLAALAQRLGAGRLEPGNSVESWPDTNDAFAAMERAIRSAQERLHVQYYIWRADRLGTRFRDLLIEKARQGVTVRFIYDGIGSIGLRRTFLAPLREAGVDVTSALPGRSFRERWSLNLRNHRKLLSVDGRIAFTGGLNVGDEYLGKSAWGYWRDTQLKLRGPIVRQIEAVFAEDWFYATGERIPLSGARSDEPQSDGRLPAQVVSDGPDQDVRILPSLMLAAIMDAEESITIATGYFVPPEALQLALITAASRGMRVRLMVSGGRTYWYTLLAGRSYYQPLLDAGAEVLEYEKGLFHAKVLVVDHCWSLVGTPNFDMRSLHLNFEVAVAVHSLAFAAEMERQFEADVAHSRRIAPAQWKTRSGWEVRAENFCRLFAPLL
jgi:cardiolipin synthase